MSVTMKAEECRWLIRWRWSDIYKTGYNSDLRQEKTMADISGSVTLILTFLQLEIQGHCLSSSVVLEVQARHTSASVLWLDLGTRGYNQVSANNQAGSYSFWLTRKSIQMTDTSKWHLRMCNMGNKVMKESHRIKWENTFVSHTGYMIWLSVCATTKRFTWAILWMRTGAYYARGRFDHPSVKLRSCKTRNRSQTWQD